MASGTITADQLTEYRKKGYTLIRRMFNSQEIGLLGRSAKQDKTLDDHAFGRDDGRGKIVRLSFGTSPVTRSTACLRAANPSSTPPSGFSRARFITTIRR